MRARRGRRDGRGSPTLELPSFDPRGALRRVPLAAWLCALIACANAVSWSFITPPFESPDEPDHFAYVKQLAETGKLPTSQAETYPAEEIVALNGLHSARIRLQPSNRAIITRAEQEHLDQQLASFAGSSEKGSSSAGVATGEPPLYYALESIPYNLGSSGTLLDRLALMRLFSALLGGLSGLFSFMFLREALPRVRWSWTVGALGVALTPMFAFTSGVINPDALLFAVCAALFYCIARAFRQGLTLASAVGLGAVIAAGLLTKVNFVGLAPGALLALAILAVRGVRAPGGGLGALRLPALAAAIGCLPIVVFVASNVLSAEPTLGIVSNGLRTTRGSISGDLSYIWQFYLPRLPGMTNDFPGLSSTRQIWLDSFIGRFGWLDTLFPAWVYTAALIPVVAILGLCVCALAGSARALRTRAPEIAVYAAMALGLMTVVGADSYRSFPAQVAAFGQARYLLPLLPLLGALLALAARGAGRRWGPLVGAWIVMLFLAHDLVSQLQVVARYYG